MSQIEFSNPHGCIVDEALLSRAIHYAFPEFKKVKRQKRGILVRVSRRHIVPVIRMTVNGSKKQYPISRLIAKYLWGAAVDGNVIHHVDLDPLNNMVDNLQVMSPFEHRSFHHKGYIYHPYDEEKDEATLLYREGYTLNQLGEKYGCSYFTIRRRFVKWNIPRRPLYGKCTK